MIPKNVKKSIEVITEDPKVKAAYDIEQYINGLYKKKEKIQAEVLPNLNSLAEKFLKESWIPVWRKNPTYNGKTSSPIPDDFEVYAPFVHHTKDGKIKFQLQVQWPANRGGVEIPKKFLRQARFAHRCKKKAKRDLLVRKVDDLLVKEFKLPNGEFLPPTWDVERKPTIVCVGRTLSGYEIPFSLEMMDANKIHQDWWNRKNAVEKEIEEFRSVIPPRIQEMISSILGSYGSHGSLRESMIMPDDSRFGRPKY